VQSDDQVGTSEEESEGPGNRGNDSETEESDYGEDKPKGRKRLRKAESDDNTQAEAQAAEELEKLETELRELQRQQSSARKATQGMAEVEREAYLADIAEKIVSIQQRIQVKQRVMSKQPGSKPRNKLEGVVNKHGKPTNKYQSEESEEYEKPKKQKKESESTELTLDDIHSCCVTRSDIAKWDYFGHMNKTLTGAFVRYLIGQDPKTKESVYRLCRIEEVRKHDKEYRLEPDKPRTTRHALYLSHGKSAKVFTCDNISNRLPTEVCYRGLGLTIARMSFADGTRL